MEPKKGPQTTKNRPQEASKCLLERRCGFKARSNSILSDLGLQHSLNMGSKIAQKTLKNQLGRPKPPKGRREASRDAFFTPHGTHFGPFWAPKMVQNLLQLTLSLQACSCKALGSVAGCGGASPTGDPATEPLGSTKAVSGSDSWSLE